MSYCSNCGNKLVEGSKFCNNCGSAVNLDKNEKYDKRKTTYDGEIHKCPNCGEVLNSFLASCPSCGYEFRGTSATNSVKELAKKLEELDSKRPQRKMHTIFTQALSGGQLTHIDEQKISLIKNYSIPNTKEDVMEFVILASSNIDLKAYGLNGWQNQNINPAQREISDAWLAKFEQAYQKAQLMFGGSQEFLNICLLFEKKQKEIKKKKWQLPMLIMGVFGSIFLMFGFVMLIITITGSIK